MSLAVVQSPLWMGTYSELAEVHAVPSFYQGTVVDAYVASQCLQALVGVVRSRFAFAPVDWAAMLDPVVSVGAHKLRFEGFSSCNGVYARVDLLPASLDGEIVFAGTTNVDFNDPLVNALRGVGPKDRFELAIGTQSVDFEIKGKTIKEKKVKLPDRWVKGMAESQVYLAGMEHVFTLNRIEALTLMQSLPRGDIQKELFISRRGPKFQFTALASPGSVRVGSAHRLRLVERLLNLVDKVEIFGGKDEQCMAWVMDFKSLRMTITLSADSRRGFSGEGQLLEHLYQDVPLELVQGIQAVYQANESFSTTLTAFEQDLDFSVVDHVGARLAGLGLLGFDLSESEHFYRRLPFDAKRIAKLNPRFKNAQKLLDEARIEWVARDVARTEAKIHQEGSPTYFVEITPERMRCTCPWQVKNQGNRGICKHLLAVKMELNGSMV